MNDQFDHPVLPPDTPLRHRLWFRFWRGWRKLLIALVVLVAVAWWTRPGLDDHEAAIDAYFQATREPSNRNQLKIAPLWDLIKGLRPASGGAPREWRDFALLTTYCPPVGIHSIGAFGYVWVLD